MSEAIKVRHIFLEIKKKKILKDIDITFDEGKIHGVIGRNGSGKTVLMKCICGFVKPTEGEVRVRNVVIGKETDFPEDTGVMIETPGFIPYYTGYRNLKLLACLNKKITPKDIQQMMAEVGLDYRLKLPVKKYSLGMRQRLGIAQAIMEQPSVLILDEPFNGLDKDGVRDMREYFLRLKEQGRTIILVSHSVEDIDILCDTVAEMDKGVLTVVR